VRGGVAFNLADLSIAAGDALLVVAVLAHAWANRDRLRAPG
jgi:lipoprotein signal peptidase